MYNYSFPRPAVTCDIILLTQELPQKILLIKRGISPFKGRWALPGGFIEMNEELEESAQRELMEETGLKLNTLQQFRTYGTPNRDPRGRTITVVYHALLNNVTQAVAGDDAAEAQWFPIHDLPELAFDHDQIIQDFLTDIAS